MSADTHPLARRTELFVRDQTGVRFESLVLFSEPIFEEYGLDVGDAFAMKADSSAGDDALLAVLETARLVWAFLSLPPNEHAQRLPALERVLLGPHPEADEAADFQRVLERLAEQWRILSPVDRAVAEDVEQPTLSFDDLITHPLIAPPPALTPESGYGADHLPELEAQALFAQPLLNEAVHPDEMEDALDRASAYWELAHCPLAERDRYVREIERTFGRTEVERRHIRAEAETMLARFDALFR